MREQDKRAKALKDELEIAATAGKNPPALNAKALADMLDKVSQIFTDFAEQMTQQLTAYSEIARQVRDATAVPKSSELAEEDHCEFFPAPGDAQSDIVEDLPLLRTGLKPVILEKKFPTFGRDLQHIPEFPDLTAQVSRDPALVARILKRQRDS